VEAPSPWEEPPACTRPEKLWCEHRRLRGGVKVCRAQRTCPTEKRPQPAAWSAPELSVLQMNGHLDVATLQFLLPGRGREEIRAKLQEVDPG
jgi:hypothetical protein